MTGFVVYFHFFAANAWSQIVMFALAGFLIKPDTNSLVRMWFTVLQVTDVIVVF